MVKTILINANLFRGSKGCGVEPNMNIVMENGIIIDIFPGDLPAELDVEENRVLNMHGNLVMPGMINADACLAESGAPSKKLFRKGFGMPSGRNPFSMASYRLNCSSQASEILKSGVTSILSRHMDTGVEALIRDWLESANVDGIRIFPGSCVWTVGRVTDADRKALETTKPQVVWLEASGAADVGEIRSLAEEMREKGIRVGFTTDDVRNLEAAAPLVDLAELRTVTEDVIPVMEKNPTTTWVIPSMSERVHRMLKQNDTAAAGELNIISRILKAAFAAEIPLAIGNTAGLPGVDHLSFWKEVLWLDTLSGCGPEKALEAVTSGNAAALGIQEKTGTIEVGRCADIMVYPKDPTKDVLGLKDIGLFLVRGQIIVPEQKTALKIGPTAPANYEQMREDVRKGLGR